MTNINIQNANKAYSKGGPLAVADLSLDIPSSEFLCLLGPSGCGKSTTLRMIAGLENLTSGQIQIGDRVVDATEDGIFVPAEKRNLGMVFQNYALWPPYVHSGEYRVRPEDQKGSRQPSAGRLSIRC